jgi:uncharacterized protein (DUF1786 family)
MCQMLGRCGFRFRSLVSWLLMRSAGGLPSFVHLPREISEQFIGMKAILEVVRVGDDDQLICLRLFQKCI